MNHCRSDMNIIFKLILLCAACRFCCESLSNWLFSRSIIKFSCHVQVVQALQRVLSKTGGPTASLDHMKQHEGSVQQPQHSLFQQRCCWPPHSNADLAALQILEASEQAPLLSMAPVAVPKNAKEQHSKLQQSRCVVALHASNVLNLYPLPPPPFPPPPSSTPSKKKKMSCCPVLSVTPHRSVQLPCHLLCMFCPLQCVLHVLTHTLC